MADNRTKLACGPRRNLDTWLATVQRIMPDDCWNWPWSKSANGYGKLQLADRRLHLAHRVIYERVRGPIPPDLQLDHICRNRRCCNPDHLEAVSQRTNALRGVSFAAVNAAKTHCVNGHEYTLDNTYVHGGYRHCRLCRTTADRRRRRHAV